MQLANLIEVHLDVSRLSADLDGIGHAARLWSVHQWRAPQMATLWDALKSFRPVTLDDFVPPAVPPLATIIHHGTNSLPVASHFQKRFCRPAQSADPRSVGVLIGHNHQALSLLTGPGYFVAHASTEDASTEVDIDYTILPAEQPPSWPALEPSSSRLGRFVYAGTLDTMRGLSTHVTVGRRKRGSTYLNDWFVLVREDS